MHAYLRDCRNEHGAIGVKGNFAQQYKNSGGIKVFLLRNFQMKSKIMVTWLQEHMFNQNQTELKWM